MRSFLFACLLPTLALACTSDLASDFSDGVLIDDPTDDESRDDDDSSTDDSAADDSTLVPDDSAPLEAGPATPIAADDDVATMDDAVEDDDAVDDAPDDTSTDDAADDSLDDDASDDFEPGDTADDSPDDVTDDDSPDDTTNDDDMNADDVSTEAGIDDEPTDDDASDDDIADDSNPEPVEAGVPSTEPEASVDPPEPLRVLEIVPAPGGDGISIGTNLVLSFDRAIQLGSGEIEITNLDAAEVSYSLALDNAQVDIDGDTLTIDLDDVLLGGTNYAVRVPATAVEDGEGVFFAGLSDDTWTFETSATEVPGGVPMTDVALWLDAQLRGSVKHSAGSVRLWADRSLNHHHFRQTTSAEQPMYSGEIGTASGDAVHFDGESWLEGPVIGGSAAFELFAVWQSPVVPSDELSIIFSNGLMEEVNVQFMHGHSFDGFDNSAISFLEDDYRAVTFAPAAAGTPYLWNASFGDDGFVAYTNGTESDSVTFDGPALAATEPMTLGGFDGEFFFSGDIGEVILFERALSSEERDAVEEYIEARWGIGVTP